MEPEINPFDDEAFEALRSGNWRPPSSFTVVLPAWAPTPDPHALMARPLPEPFNDLKFELADGPQEDGVLFRLESDLVDVTCSEFDVGLGPSSEHAPDLTDADIEAAEQGHHALTVTTVLGEPVLEEFHAAIRLCDALAPDAVALRDDGAMVWRPATWIQSTVSSVAPPSPLHLFTLHLVGDEGALWIHTHGLIRCGTIELEILGAASSSAQALSHLINAAAMRTIEQGPPDPGEPFLVGKDMEVAWLPWEQGIESTGFVALGGMEDREDHDFLVGSLVAPTGRMRGFIRKRPIWGSVEAYVPIIEDNPIFFRSTMETQRASMLASEHFGVFRDLVTRFAGQPGWDFSVKLGYQMDARDGEDEPDNEHLWFEVHGVDGARIDATLLNQPYHVARMKAGDRDWHHADQLSDWSVDAFDRVFRPDSIAQLLHRLAADEG